MSEWRGFYRESRSFMSHLPLWRFLLRYPAAWMRYRYYEWKAEHRADEGGV